MAIAFSDGSLSAEDLDALRGLNPEMYSQVQAYINQKYNI